MFKIWSRDKQNYLSDTFSGITVSLALVPEAIAFALVAGVAPISGLMATFFVGLIAAMFGGRPGMISGATGALAVVMVSIVQQHGVQYLYATVIMMGIIQVLCGIFKLGKFIWMVPYPVLIGAVNGLAIVIGISQLEHFKHNSSGHAEFLTGNTLIVMLLLVIATMFMIKYIPKISRKIPATLIAITLITSIVYIFNLDTPNVGSMGNISGDFPSLHFPNIPYNWQSIKIILPYAFVLSTIGLIESLLTLGLLDEITHTHGNTNRECIGQGASNVVAGFFATMGGCAMIGQSVLNVESGGRGRLSGIIAAICVLTYVLFIGEWIEKIPIASLAGVMFIVVIETFEWSSFRIMHRIPRSDAFVLLVVSILTVVINLSIAVFIGVIIAALIFAWKHASTIQVKIIQKNENRKTYKISGPLFFSSVKKFKSIFKVSDDPDEVVIDFIDSRVCDHSALKAIDDISARYQRAGKRIKLVHLSEDCKLLLKKGSKFVVNNSSKDPFYHIATDD